MDDVTLPPMPEVDFKQMLPYSAIRYVAGYPAQYVQQFAKAYAREAVLAERKAERERCAKICEGKLNDPNQLTHYDMARAATENMAYGSCAAAIRNQPIEG